MITRRAWEALQNRWARGDALSAQEESARRERARIDRTAQREQQLFEELRARLDCPEEPGAAALAERALAAARGSRLRLVAPGEGPSLASEPRSLVPRLSLVAGIALLCLSGAWFARRHTQPRAPRAGTAVATRPVPAPAAAPRTRSELVFVSGEVDLGGHAASVGNRTLTVGDVLHTRKGRACLTIDPAIDVCLERDSEVVIESLAEAEPRVRVTHGTAVAALAPRSAGRTFSLLSEDLVATARGTLFAIDRDPEQRSAQVSVVEGKVEVRRASEPSTLVSAHSRLALRAGSAADNGSLGRAEEARFWSLLAPRELWQGSRLGVLEVGGAEPDQRVLVDERGPFALPLSSFVSADHHRLQIRAGSGARTNLDAEVEAGQVRHVSAEDAARPAARASSSPAQAAQSPAALLDEARQKLIQGDAPAARATYERLRTAYPASPEAVTVLVTLGKLELDLGAPARALSAFDEYLRRGGPLAPEALSGKIRALRALGRNAEERAACQDYLTRYPGGFDAPTMKKRLEALARP